MIDVQAFFACLDSLDRSNQFSPERMEIEITKLFATPDSAGENVQMMTIHKSKGLEFDTVILPGLGATTGGNNGDKAIDFMGGSYLSMKQTRIARCALHSQRFARRKQSERL